MLKKRRRVLSVNEMRELDRKAIEDYGIPSLLLMENAGRSVAEASLKMLKSRKKGNRVTLVSGKGNNGGDGLVAARHLINSGMLVSVFIIAESEKSLKGDPGINYGMLRKMKADIQFLKGETWELEALEPAFRASDLIIDALFGTGLSHNLEDPYYSIVQSINESGRPILSIDIPSGLNGDTGTVMGIAVRADRTITLACFKSGLLKGKGPQYTGKVEIGYISIPAQLIS